MRWLNIIGCGNKRTVMQSRPAPFKAPARSCWGRSIGSSAISIGDEVEAPRGGAHTPISSAALIEAEAGDPAFEIHFLD